jgi:hypothetical protein
MPDAKTAGPGVYKWVLRQFERSGNHEGIFDRRDGASWQRIRRELIRRGNEVVSIALPPLPPGAVLPAEMKIEFGNYLDMTDDQLKSYMAAARDLCSRRAWTSVWRVRRPSTTCIKSTISTR